jgi:hypothetical protein
MASNGQKMLRQFYAPLYDGLTVSILDGKGKLADKTFILMILFSTPLGFHWTVPIFKL